MEIDPLSFSTERILDKIRIGTVVYPTFFFNVTNIIYRSLRLIFNSQIYPKFFNMDYS